MRNYNLTDDDREVIEALLNLASITAGSQIDDDAKEDAYALIDTVAKMFDIESTRFIIEEYDEDDGSITLNIRADDVEVDAKPKLTLVSNESFPKESDSHNDNDNNDIDIDLEPNDGC